MATTRGTRATEVEVAPGGCEVRGNDYTGGIMASLGRRRWRLAIRNRAGRPGGYQGATKRGAGRGSAVVGLRVRVGLGTRRCGAGGQVTATATATAMAPMTRMGNNDGDDQTVQWARG